MIKKTLVVIGAGAAGVFAAVNAARLNDQLEVVVVEKTHKLLSKVKVSGGGRCNVTHACFEIAEMSKRYPRGGNFVKKTFHQFFTTDTIEWFSKRGVELKQEADGRMFPVTDNSQTIIDCLLEEVTKRNVVIRISTEVKELKWEGDHWQLSLIASGRETSLNADYIIIASGGFAKSIQFDWIKKLGHSIAAPVPSLFTFNMPGNNITALMGISIDMVKLKVLGTKLEQEGPLLITHWGLSGPAVLKLSAWGARELAERDWKFEIIVNWCPENSEQQTRDQLQQLRFSQAAQKISSRNAFGLPQRFWDYLLQETGVNPAMRWADLPAKLQQKLGTLLAASIFKINGKTTFKEEFVTAGGVQLSEIDANTMASKKCEQLYFAGEIMDVDGITGGYNFQHAWTSGFIAASSIAKEVAKNQ